MKKSTIRTLENIPSAQKKQFQIMILERYDANKRDLPWRKTVDPYKILISECMSQQTQVSRVIPKYEAWLEKWPTVFDVAQASRTEILHERVWLWFNRRAINLHDACKKIAHDAGSDTQVLQNMADYAYLRTLPWVWEYTAGAICAFAYNQEVVVLDINIKRVLLHSFQLPTDTPLWEIQELALSLVPSWRSREWYNALMDYGSLVLHSKATGIRSAKQSQFKWSDREVRGWILKQLTGKWKESVVVNIAKDVQKNNLSKHKKIDILALEIATIQAEFPLKDVETIIAGMVKDELVKVEDSIVTLV